MVKWIAVVVVVLVALGAAWYFLAGGGPLLRGKRSECDQKRAALAAAKAKGDANAIAQITLQLAECDKDLQALGATGIDPLGSQLSNCVSSFDLVYPALSDIMATDRSDWLKRGNIWRNALHFATDAQQCLAAIAQQVESKEGLARLRTIVRDWGVRMRAVQNRLYRSSHGGESGLDAYSGSPEPGGDDKAHAWLTGVVDPLWATLRNIDTKLAALDPSNAGLTTELATLAANPTSIGGSVFGE